MQGWRAQDEYTWYSTSNHVCIFPNQGTRRRRDGRAPTRLLCSWDYVEHASNKGVQNLAHHNPFHQIFLNIRTNTRPPTRTHIPGWPRGRHSSKFGAAGALFGMTPRSQGGGGALGAQEDEGGDGGFGDALAASEPASNGKGPKSFFRQRVLPCRKLVALVAVGLCILAGESDSCLSLVGRSGRDSLVHERTVVTC